MITEDPVTVFVYLLFNELPVPEVERMVRRMVLSEAPNTDGYELMHEHLARIAAELADRIREGQ